MPATDVAEIEALSERRRLQVLKLRNRLANQRRFLAQALHAGKARIWLWDFDRQQLIWRKSISGPDGSLKLEQGRLSKEQFKEMVLAEDLAHYEEAFTAGLKTGTYQCEYRIRLLNGELGYMSASGQLIPSVDGKSRYMAGLVVDQTAEYQARLRRDRSDKMLEMALEGEPLVVWVQDPDLVFTTVYNMPESLEGKVLGYTDFDLDTDDDYTRQLVEAKRRVMATCVTETVEGWRLAPDKSMLGYYRIKLEPLPIPGKGIGILGKRLDLTEVMHAQDKIRLERDLYQLAMRTAGISVFAQDQDLRFRWAFDPVMGYATDAVVGLQDTELGLDPKDMRISMDFKQSVLAKGKAASKDIWIGRPGEAKTFVKMVCEPYSLPEGGTGLVVATINMTDAKERQQELRQYSRELEAEKARAERAQLDLTSELDLRREEAEQARLLQLAMLPAATALPLPHWDMATYLEACPEIGGDYYDYLAHPAGGYILALGDATGYGLKAGLVVAMVRSYFQLLANEQSPAQMLNTISGALAKMELPHMYMALTIVHIRQGQITVAMAGMPPIWICRGATGLPELHLEPNLYLGTGLAQPYQEHTLPFWPGDVLLVMTDGVLEAATPDGAPLGEDKVLDCLSVHADKSASHILTNLKVLFKTHMEGYPLRDDLTLAVVKG